MNGTEVLRIEGLTKDFTGLRAVNNVSTELMPQELRAIIGPNGAGKTTLFNLITGQLKSNGGRIFFEGQEITGFSPHRVTKKGISRTFQITHIFPRMTVLQNVRTAVHVKQGKTFNPISQAHKLALDETAELLLMTGLLPHANKVSGTLSLGDQKVLELAIALAAEPRLLLLDEPTAGMASYERMELMNLVTRIVSEKQITVLFIEHETDVVFSIAQRISVMHRRC